MNVIPDALIQADASRDWPFGRRLSGSLLARTAKFMEDIDFELLSISEIVGDAGSDVAELDALHTFVKNPRLARMFRLYSAFNPEGPSDLPWLDVDKALVVGGGADYGDDVWIALDARINPISPRLVLNQFYHFGPEGARTAPSHAEWIELAPNIESFLSMLSRRPRE